MKLQTGRKGKRCYKKWISRVKGETLKPGLLLAILLLFSTNPKPFLHTNEAQISPGDHEPVVLRGINIIYKTYGGIVKVSVDTLTEVLTGPSYQCFIHPWMVGSMDF